MTKIGVLIVNLGTPDAPTRGAVYRYLRQFLTDGRVIDYPWLFRQMLVQGIIAPIRSGKSAKAYQQLWTPQGSPLKYYGEVLVREVQRHLGQSYAVELGMRYQNPSMESAIRKLLDQRVQRIIVLPLFPQYASATTGSVHEEVMRILSKEQTMPDLELIQSYPTYEPMIDVFVENARKLNPDHYDHILFSFHGVPKRHLRKGDRCNHCLKTDDCCQVLSDLNAACYSAQCHATTHAIAQKLNLSKDRYTLCFQSRLGVEEWAKPYTSEVLEQCGQKGYKRLLVFSPAFVSDCLETTIEIGDEYREEYEQKFGGHLDLVPSLNDNPTWIRGVADLIAARS